MYLSICLWWAQASHFWVLGKFPLCYLTHPVINKGGKNQVEDTHESTPLSLSSKAREWAPQQLGIPPFFMEVKWLAQGQRARKRLMRGWEPARLTSKPSFFPSQGRAPSHACWPADDRYWELHTLVHLQHWALFPGVYVHNVYETMFGDLRS